MQRNVKQIRNIKSQALNLKVILHHLNVLITLSIMKWGENKGTTTYLD